MPVVLTATRSNHRVFSFSIFVLTLLTFLGASSIEGQSNIKYDFTGSGAAEIGRWHPGNNEFKVWDISGQNFSTYTLGNSASKPAPGDFDGDLKTDAGVFFNGVWTYKTSPGAAVQTISMSSYVAGDIPAAGDFDGDNKTDAAIFRPSTGTWLIKQSSNNNNTEVTIAFGQAGDIPIAGKFDTDNVTDVAIYRPATGTWWYRRSIDGVFNAVQWGVATDIPLHGDFDGDGRSDMTVFRPTDGSWYMLYSLYNFSTYSIENWGNWADQPVPANYDTDAKTDVAIWRPTTGQWYILKSTGGVDIHGLGFAGNTAIPSSYTKQIGGEVGGSPMATARNSPKNATGGTDYYSRNFGWGTSLVGLLGRAGMDAGIGLSYNSLVWINVNSAMYFDPDKGNLAPGFRFGPPVIEPAYYDSAKKKWTYLMVTPDGRRVEFRQNKASADYITTDSSYARLSTKGSMNPNDPPEENNLTVTTSDGTAMVFEWTLGGYRCMRVTDRNGNYIVYTYDAIGRLMTMTDTLGRVVNLTYNPDGTLWKITQPWSTGTHAWASFSYTTKTVSTSFSIPAYGPPNGTSVTVLDKVTYADGSKTKFTYNGYLQVTAVENRAENDSLLNSTAPSYTSMNAADAPKLTSTAITTSNFNGGGNSTVTITNDGPNPGTFTAPNISESTSVVDITVSPHPNSLTSRIHYAPSGWKEGLTIATEDCVSNCGSARKRWTWNQWTQDSTTISYILNPRVTESRVGDEVNVKQTVLGYTSNEAPDTYHLPTSMTVTNMGTGGQIASSTTSYVTSAAYIDKRILRLPSFATSSGLNSETNNLEVASSTNYFYDEGTFTEPGQNITAFQHDSGTHGASFIIGRGNVTTIQRNNVSGGGSTNVEIKYNVTGSPVKQLDARDRPTTISYNDNFVGSPPTPTYAYPTSIKDAGEFVSTIQYRYDIGANVSASSPNGFSSSRTFDSVGRLSQQSVSGGAYTRYEYSANGRQINTFSTITDGLGETMSETWTDGAGRTFRSRSELPNSNGGWSAVKTTYDVLGRVIEQSVPTEVNSSWNPTGDDSSWKVSTKTYDWKDRVTNTMPAGASGDANTIITYEGCGCTGGQITTIQGPMVQRDDDPGLSARRVTKVYDDVLGRQWKTVAMKWDGISPHLTTETFFNGRSQPKIVNQTDPNNGNPIVQTTTMDYDGYGRLTSRHNPIETAGMNTTYSYNDDDTVATMTDPRGASATYTYGNLSLSEKRPLLVGIAYAPPATQPTPPILDTPDVAFTYDSVGNRLSMSDGSGTKSYVYNVRSQLESETKTFTGLAGNFTLGYGYQIGGKLKSVTDPFGAVVSYNDDKTGRTTSITGANFAGVPNHTYASGIQYRAFGGIKGMSYGSNDGSQISYGYDEQLRVSSYQATSSVQSGGFIRKATYEYFGDSRTKKVNNILDTGLDQNYKFDSQGRLTSSISGQKLDSQNQLEEPFTQAITYNAFSDMTSRTNHIWGDRADFTASYTNGRKAGIEIYDHAGNIIDKTITTNKYDRWKFDAAGRNVETVMRWHTAVPAPSIDQTETIAKTFDGDGLDTKRVDTKVWFETFPGSSSGTEVTAEYYVRSSVLDGRVVTKLDGNGAKKVTLVYTGKGVLAEQRVINNTPGVYWRHEDITTGSYSKIGINGEYGGYADDSPSALEYDPLGGKVEPADPTDETLNPAHLMDFKSAGDNARAEAGCMIDWMPAYCNDAYQTVRSGAGVYYNGPPTEYVRYNGRSGWAPYLVYQDGYGGYVPSNARYRGDGVLEPNEANNKKARKYDTNFSLLNGSRDSETDLRWLEETDFAALPSKEGFAIYNALGWLSFDLNELSKNCKEKVFDKLAASPAFKDFDLEKFKNFITDGLTSIDMARDGVGFYDGTRSTAPIIAATGYQAGGILYPGAKSISDIFKSRPGLQALASLTSPTFRVFLRPGSIDTSGNGNNSRNKALIIHEGLHSFGGGSGGYFDDVIQKALGLSVDARNTGNISEYIEKHCFKGK